jgi:hypothetical protein
MRKALERVIAYGTIGCAVGIVVVGPRHWLALVICAIVVWTLPLLVLAIAGAVRFSVWRFAVCWLLVPALLGTLIFYTSAMIQFGGPFGQLRLYGVAAWLRSVAIALAQGLIVAFVIGTIARGLTEALLLVLPSWRQRAERWWPLVFIIGVTIAIFLRYS